MVRNCNKVFILSALLAVSGCSINQAAIKEQAVMYQQLADSALSWQQLKQAKGDYYQYSLVTPAESQGQAITTLTVINDRVSSRSYRLFDEQHNVKLVWQEIGEEALGRHIAGAQPRTMEQLYHYCEVDLLGVSPLNNQLNINFDENNLLQQCTYQAYNCSQDCTVGFRFTQIEFIADN